MSTNGGKKKERSVSELIEIYSYASNKADEYDKTSDGKTLKDRFFNSQDNAKTDEEIDKSRSYGREYVMKQATYVAEKLIEKYGLEGAAEVGFISNYTDKDDLIQKFVDDCLLQTGLK